MKPFVHLHVHSEKSFKDGCSDFDALIAETKKLNQPALALTDHGTMYDAMGFYLKAQKAGIKPILGCEVYMIPEGSSKSLRKSDDPDEEGDTDTVPYFHLVLLAKNYNGLVNLHKLCSIAGDRKDGHFYYRPRLFRKDLEENCEDIICLSACIGGEIPKLITANELKLAAKCAAWYKKIFGDDYYLEIQNHDIPAEKKVANAIKKIASKLDIKIVLTNDCHYAKQSNYKDHRLLKCISYKEDFYDAPNYDKYFPNDSFYIKSDKEMYVIAKDYGCVQAYTSAYEISEKCDIKIDTSMHFPRADLSHPDKKRKRFKTASAKLRYIVARDKHEKYPDDYDKASPEEIVERIQKEISDINKGQFPDYFLNVYDIIKYAKDNNILIGPGRGSGAGSIVSNILNITDVDPIEFDLIWERFWNPGRCVFDSDGNIISASPPDLDIDIPSNRRDEIFDFTKQHFGKDRVASIITFGTYKGRNLVRDGAKALGFSEDLSAQILKAMPYKGTPSLAYCFDNVPACIDLYNKNKAVAEFIDRILPISGCSTNASSHAGGIVITDDIMWKYAPTFEGKNGLTTQYPYETLEAIGCLKIDLLGHIAEQIIDDACMLIKMRHGVDINPYMIPNDDDATYSLLQDVRMVGIPQLQADWVIPIIQDVQPSHIEDIIALVTMIRPGSTNSGQTDKYRDACKGLQVQPDVKELSPVVEKYNNCLLYQEQIMELARLLGGFSLEEADELRKVCAKTKYKDKEAEMLKKLEDGMRQNNIPKGNRKKILEIVRAFFGYSFNKAHAAGYGLTSYRMAYLKANYFLELTTAQLNSVIGNLEDTSRFLDELLYMGYKILPPDVNASEVVWTCDDEGVRVPPGAVSGVGPACVEAIVEERELKGEYTSFEDFVIRLPGQKVNATAIGNLICVGAFDSLGYTRKSLWEQCDDIIASIRSNKKSNKKGNTLFESKSDNKNKSTIKDLGEFPIKDIQTDENNLLGFVISLTEDELRILKKRINKKYAKLKGESNNNKRLMDKRQSQSRRFNKKNVEIDDDDEDDDKSENVSSNSIKNNIKDKLRLLSPRKEEALTSADDGDSKSLIISISDYSILPEKLFRVLKKFGDEVNGDCDVVFVLTTKDESIVTIYTEVKVRLGDELLVKLKKIVGKNNVTVQ